MMLSYKGVAQYVQEAKLLLRHANCERSVYDILINDQQQYSLIS